MRARPLDPINALYEQQVNACETLLAEEPEVLNLLSSHHRAVLRRYLFAGRDVDVDDVFDYRENLLKQEPELERQALEALVALLDLLHYPKEDRTDLLDISYYR